MSQDNRQKSVLAGMVAMAIMAPVSAQASGTVLANVLLFGSAQQAASTAEEYDSQATDARAPEPEEVRPFESLRSKSLIQKTEDDTEKRYSIFGFRGTKNSFFLPLYKEQATTRQDAHRLLDGWGLKWQHQLESGNSFAVSAHRSDNLYQKEDVVTGETTSTMASFSWTSRWKNDYKPSFTGSLFLGDEISASEKESDYGRRYYGFSVGGEMTVFKKHTPYLSIRMQKNEYADGDNGSNDLQFADSLLPHDQATNYLYGPEIYSRFSAGWNWRVRSNWSVTAEANYLFEENEYDFTTDQSRFYFGTRYDFR